MANLEFKEWLTTDIVTPYYGRALPGSNPKAFILPRYQRSFVWDDAKREALVDSIKNDYPIGTLIVRDRKETTKIADSSGGHIDAPLFELLDGLQRSTTILLNRLHPLELVSADHVDDALASLTLSANGIHETLVNAGGTPKKNFKLSKFIAEWAAGCSIVATYPEDPAAPEKFDVAEFDNSKFKEGELARQISQSYSLEPHSLEELLRAEGKWDSFLGFSGRLKSTVDISGKKIPVLIWSGPPEGTAVIFERVNQGGVKLNRYQQLAASWSDIKTDITNGIIHKAATSALGGAEAGSVVKRTTAKNSDRLDLYEALVGLSEVMTERYPHLFTPAPKPKKKSDTGNQELLQKSHVNYHAFNIVAIAKRVKITDLFNLKFQFDPLSDFEDVLEVQKFFSVVLEACDVAGQALQGLRYGVKNKFQAAHSDASMAALVASLVVASQNGTNIKTVNHKELIRHYLMDMLTGLNAQSHASDVAAFARVWVEDSSKNLVLNSHYLKQVDSSKLQQALEEFWDRQKTKVISKEQSQRPSIEAKQKATIRLYLTQQVNAAAVSNIEGFDIDHIIPFKKVLSWISEKSPDHKDYWVGSLTNLCVLPTKLNLSKSKDSLEEWLIKATGPKATKLQKEILAANSATSLRSLSLQTPKETLAITSGPGNPTAAQFNSLQQEIWDRIVAWFIS